MPNTLEEFAPLLFTVPPAIAAVRPSVSAADRLPDGACLWLEDLVGDVVELRFAEEGARRH